MPAERRGVTEPPLCGRARGAVVNGAPVPELPRITWTAASPPPEPVQQGLVGCIELGQTEAAKMFGGVLYKGIVTRFQHPYYQVTYADGDVEELSLIHI